MTDEHKKRSLNVYTAAASDDNAETRCWEPDGDELLLKNHQGGYFTNSYRLSKDINMSGVVAGRNRGFISFVVEDGSDPVGKELMEEWRQGRIEVVCVYREWKQIEDMWENKKTVVVWGYISTADLHPGECSVSLEVHCVRVITQNESVGTRDYAIDCVTGSSTIKGGTLGARHPQVIPCTGTPEAGNWGPPLDG